MSEVTALDFRNTLFTAFDTFWAKRTQIAPPNVAFNPDTLPTGETAWVRLYILGDATGQVRFSRSVTPHHFQRSGLFTVEVYVREGTDLDQAYALAEAAQEFLAKPGVANSNFFNVSQPQEIGPIGAWFQVSVTAAWLYWTDRAA